MLLTLPDSYYVQFAVINTLGAQKEGRFEKAQLLREQENVEKPRPPSPTRGPWNDDVLPIYYPSNSFHLHLI